MCVAPHQDTQYIAALIPHYTHAPELLSMNGGCGNDSCIKQPYYITNVFLRATPPLIYLSGSVTGREKQVIGPVVTHNGKKTLPLM